jgi:hypothetical protein
VRGEEHLALAPGAKILLGFHLGYPSVDLALRLGGRRITWIGGRRGSPGWRRCVDLLDADPVDLMGQPWEARLYTAHRILAEGGTVYMSADGVPGGRQAFGLELTGGRQDINAGWLVLRRRLGVPTFPVTARMEAGRTVVSIHPPLPDPHPDPERDAAACREVLTGLLEAHVRRYPEQALVVAFPPDEPRPGRPWP